MHFSAVAAVAIPFFSVVTAIPFSGMFGTRSDDTAKRGDSVPNNGEETFFIVTCDGKPHGTQAVYYTRWQDAQTYGQHAPDAVSWTNGYPILNFTTSPYPFTGYTFEKFNLFIGLSVADPGWYNPAGNAFDTYGTNYTCRMDNGRLVYSNCASNYYCS